MKFELNENEVKEAKEWIKEHSKTCPYSFEYDNLPATGEHYYYKFVPGGLGCGVFVGCLYCNVEKDITDISNW